MTTGGKVGDVSANNLEISPVAELAGDAGEDVLDVIQDVVEIKFDGDVAVSLSTEEKKISSLEALSSVDEIIFVKPNKEILGPSIMYEMISGDDQKLFYVKRKPSSKYHNQCDIQIVDRDGNHVFRLIGSKINPFKIVVMTDTFTYGTVFRTNWSCCCSPRFLVLDSSRRRVATIHTKEEIRNCCIDLPMCCCGMSFGLFEIYQRRAPGNKNLPKEIKIGTIARETFDDDEMTGGVLGIQFDKEDLDNTAKCLLISAALFLDFTIFETEKSRIPDLLIFGILFVLLLAGVALAGFMLASD